MCNYKPEEIISNDKTWAAILSILSSDKMNST